MDGEKNSAEAARGRNLITRRFSPLCGLSSSSCKGLRPSPNAFCQAKKNLCAVLALGHFWCSVVTPVTFSSDLREGYNLKIWYILLLWTHPPQKNAGKNHKIA